MSIFVFLEQANTSKRLPNIIDEKPWFCKMQKIYKNIKPNKSIMLRLSSSLCKVLIIFITKIIYSI